MSLTEQICIPFTILIFLSYIGIAAYFQLLMPYKLIGLPQKGELCPNQYIKYTSENLFNCVSDCNTNTITKILINHNIIKNINQQQFIPYENIICLPIQDKEFLKLEPYTQKTLQIYISQSLKEDLLLTPFFIFMSISIIYCLLYYYKKYPIFITQNLDKFILINFFIILLLLLAQITSIKEAYEILNLENVVYELPQMIAVFRLKALEFPYIIYLAVLAIFLILLALNQFIFELDYSTFVLSHWFTIKYYAKFIQNKSQWPLTILQIINFMTLYAINMNTLAISEKSQQYAYGELSMIYNIIVPSVSLILFFYFSLIFCILGEYNLYTSTNTSISKIGKAAIQSFLLILCSPLLLINGLLNYNNKIGKNFEVKHLTSIGAAQDFINNQNEHLHYNEQSSFNESRPILYYALNKQVNRISLSLAFLITALMVLFKMYVPAATGLCILIYTLCYINLYPVIMTSLRYTYLPDDNLTAQQSTDIGKEQKYIKCLLYIFANQNK